jgi:hypothetical protein
MIKKLRNQPYAPKSGSKEGKKTSQMRAKRKKTLTKWVCKKRLFVASNKMARMKKK